jgi:hypothetical protein
MQRGHKPEPELDRLSNILKSFNEQFGTLFTDTDRVAKRIRDDIAPKVAADAAYQNARENTPHTARMAHDQALAKVMQHLLKDDTQVYKQFVENESFKRFGRGDMVYAITNGVVYGPFHATAAAGVRGYQVSLAPPDDERIFEIDPEALGSLPGVVQNLTVNVSLTTDSPNKTARPLSVSYELMTDVAPEVLARRGLRSRPMVSDDRLVKRLAADLLTRKKKQEVTRALSQLAEVATERGENGPSEAALERTLEALRRDDVAADRISRALLDSGVLDEQIKAAVLERTEEYVQQQAATLHADIQSRLAVEERRLETARRDSEQLAESIDAIRRSERTRLDEEIRRKREEADNSLREREAEIQRQRQDLQQQTGLLRDNLEDVVQRYTGARAEVLNQFIALAPLLERVGIMGGTASPGASASPLAEQVPTPASAPPFVAAPYVRATVTNHAPVSEAEFFNRFSEHVKGSGFSYRSDDLLSFHLSMKCCDLSVLGGVSGTGKSTLPRLYSEALAGEYEEGRNRYRPIPVSPSWLDMRDLIGHVNAVLGQFQPSETGLYAHLINAQEEYASKGSESGIHIVCLDEMNLSHVEHYFGVFLQQLEQVPQWRTVRCFDPTSVNPESTYAQWAEIRLSPALRFVGTVNFDETTKQLSARLLDRVNLLHLRPSNLDALAPMTSYGAQAVAGRAISLRDFNAWTRDAPLESRFAEVIDSMQRHLQELGCPLNPRRIRGIHRFIASAGNLCNPEKAFDLQIAQRVLPQIRAVFSSSARLAVDALERIMDDHGGSMAESRAALADLKRRNDGFAEL